MQALYAMPAFALLFLAILFAVCAACGAEYFFQRVVLRGITVDRTSAGVMTGIVGTLYSVILGFIVGAAWQQYDATRAHVGLEAASVGDAWHSSVGLAPQVRSAVRRDMLEYAHTMLDADWPAMRHGEFSARGDSLIMDATSAVNLTVPTNDSQSNAQQATAHLLNDLHDERQLRLSGNISISPFQWVILLMGSFVVVGFCCLFGIPHRRLQLAMLGAVTTMIASVLVLLFELQAPFRSDLGIPSTPWAQLIAHIQDMDAPSAPEPMKM
jgi:hypothetical protein